MNLLRVLELPAFVTGRTFDVLASNAGARAISKQLTAGRNRLRSVFLDEDERALYRDWDVRSREREMTRLRHPVVGDLDLFLGRLDVPGTIGQSLVVYHPAEGSTDATRLAALTGTPPR